MENKTMIFRFLESMLLWFSLIFQMVSLVTPGWIIAFLEDIDCYYGIFYSTVCKHRTRMGESMCVTKTWYGHHYEYVWQNSTEVIIQEGDNSYYYHIRNQVALLVCFAITMLCLSLQSYKLKHKRHGSICVTAISMSCLAFTGALMIYHLSAYYIDTYYLLHYKLGDTETLGFPYCVVIYTVAFMAIIAILIVDTVEIHKKQKEYFGHMQLIRADDRSRPMYGSTDTTATTAGTSGQVNYGMIEHDLQEYARTQQETDSVRV